MAGGDTMFANMFLACEALSAPIEAALQAATCIAIAGDAPF